MSIRDGRCPHVSVFIIDVFGLVGVPNLVRNSSLFFIGCDDDVIKKKQ